MQELVPKRDEPITPFVDRIRELRDTLGVSTVLVMGGSGDYFAHADTVIQMHDYLPRDVTAEAHRIAAEHADGRREEGEVALAAPRPRALQATSLDPADARGKVKVKVRGLDTLVYARDDVDLRAVEQLVDPSQVRGIARVLQRLAGERADRSNAPSPQPAERQAVDRGDGPPGGGLAGDWIEAPVQRVAEWLAADWGRLAGRPDGDLARPRLAEVMAALNRLRSARFRGAGAASHR